MKRFSLFALALLSAASMFAVDVPSGTPFDVNCGSDQTLNATPEKKFHFVNWTDATDAVLATTPTYTISDIQADVVVNANFAENAKVTVLVENQTDHTTVADVLVAYIEETDVPKTHKTVFTVDEQGDEVKVYALLSDDCYEFVKWTVGGVDADVANITTNATQTILTLPSVNADTEVHAVYKIKTFKVTVNYNTAQGTVTR